MKSNHFSHLFSGDNRVVTYLGFLAVSRIVLPMALAFMALIGTLSWFLSAEAHTAVNSVPPVAHPQNNTTTRSNCPGSATLDVTKIANPTEIISGGEVLVNFTIAGLNEVRPVDIVLLHDLSRSMLALEDAKEDAIEFIEKNLTASDRVSLVTLGRDGQLLVPLTTDRNVITTTISGLSNDKNAKYVWRGIDLAHTELISSNFNTNSLKAIILLSDDQGRISDETKASTITRALRAQECGIPIYTIGYGYDEEYKTFLQDIAEITDGAYYEAPTSADLMTIYQEIVMGLRNLTLTDVFPPGVEIDCGNVPGGWDCVQGVNKVTTLTYQIGNERPIFPDPLSLSLTTTVSTIDNALESNRFINSATSCVNYDGPGNPNCQFFDNPIICVYRSDDYESSDKFDEGVERGEEITSTSHALSRNFSNSSDEDWIRVSYNPKDNTVFTFQTNVLSGDGGDLFLQLSEYYSGTPVLTSGINTLTWPPDYDYGRVVYLPIILNNGSAMSIKHEDNVISSPASPDDIWIYYLRVVPLENTFVGCNTAYTIFVDQTSP